MVRRVPHEAALAHRPRAPNAWPRVDAWSPSLLAHPALGAVRPYADRLAALDDWPSVEALDALLSDRLAIEPAVSLERQHRKRKRRRAPLDRSAIYAVRIHEHRRVPTRERSLHDLTNALVWAAFPRSKRALAARQHAITIARVPPGATALPNARTREEDALAMLDEGGILIAATPDRAPALEAALRAEDHAALRGAPAHVFGHALMEHAIGGRTDVRGYALVLSSEAPREVDAVDAALAAWIASTDALSSPATWRALPLDAVVQKVEKTASRPAEGAWVPT